ncbi:MAG: hypothetical protein AAFY57_15315 [Cyanobacteria bacterium J06642_2]
MSSMLQKPERNNLLAKPQDNVTKAGALRDKYPFGSILLELLARPQMKLAHDAGHVTRRAWFDNIIETNGFASSVVSSLGT